jgi:pullulanase/glycogen debranching enzyme
MTAFKVVPGDGTTLGAIPRDGGVNFAVASSLAEEVTLCLFDADGSEAQVAPRARRTTRRSTRCVPGSPVRC